jgi:hypothetical protein
MSASQTITLDRQRIKDGARKGEATAAFVLTLEDAQGSRILWRGFNRAAGLEAAKSWTDRAARFVDKTETCQ